MTPHRNFGAKGLLFAGFLTLTTCVGALAYAADSAIPSITLTIGTGGSQTGGALVSGSVQRVSKQRPRLLTVEGFLIDACNRLGDGVPSVANDVVVRWPGVVKGTPLYRAIQKCAYLGVLESRGKVTSLTLPVKFFFIQDFLLQKIGLTIPHDLEREDLVSIDFWNNHIRYKIPTYAMVQRMLKASAWGSKDAYRSPLLQSPYFGALSQVYSSLSSDYYAASGAADQEKLLYGAVQGMAAGLGDPFTIYFAPDKSTEFFDSIQNEYYGIGAYVDALDGYFVLQSLIAGSPAMEAGAQPGDRVLEVNGWKVPVVFSIDEVIAKIKGPVGTYADLLIERQGRQLQLRIERRKISIPLMKAEKKGQTFVWTISSFGKTLDALFAKSLTDHAGDIASSQKLIIDLRNNGGGYTDVATNILQWFVPAGEIIMQSEYINGSEHIFSQGVETSPFSGKNVTILINGGTASAAEILAGVIKEYLPNTEIVGEQSYGKGSMQTVITLPNAGTVKYTIALWFIGKSKTSINKVGITPDRKMVDDPKTKIDEVLESEVR